MFSLPANMMTLSLIGMIIGAAIGSAGQGSPAWKGPIAAFCGVLGISLLYPLALFTSGWLVVILYICAFSVAGGALRMGRDAIIFSSMFSMIGAWLALEFIPMFAR